MNKPRVLHLIPTFGPGGAEHLVFELVQRLPRHGFEAQAVSLMGGGSLVHLFQSSSLPHQVFERRGPFGASAFRYAREVIKRERPAIVHTHLFGADLWGRLAALSVFPRARLVTTEHNVHPEYGTLQRGLNYGLSFATDIEIAVSATVKRYMTEEEGISVKRIRVIRNGIDLEKIAIRSTRPFSDVPRLLVVGRLESQKGHATLFKALAFVKRPWRLDVVGIGQFKRALSALADRLGIAPRIRWFGYRTDVGLLLRDADLFCFPSLWEGSGLALLEAAAAAVPIIASDLPAFHEVFDASSVAFVPPGDVPALAHAIDAVLADPASALKRAEEARDQIERCCSIEKMVKAYASVYRKLLA